MPAICLYFKVHQPYRLRRFSLFDIGQEQRYFDTNDGSCLDNQVILKRVAQKCYLPTTQILIDICKKYPDFKVAFSLSGLLLEQLKKDFPEVLELFKALYQTGQMEITGETYFHSLAFLASKKEFIAQVKLQEKILSQIFGLEKPRVFVNTEAAYSNGIGDIIQSLGYKAVLTEGADKILEWRSPNFVYQAQGSSLKLLLKNYRLSDDIAFRFSQKSWPGWPLTAEKYASWISQLSHTADVINIFMDYETFGEHQWEETGIFEFLKNLPRELLRQKNNIFMTPSEVITKFSPVATLNIPQIITWADTERDLSAWQENSMQRTALKHLYDLEQKVLASGQPELIENWRRLQTSDHFYYMCTKWFADGDVHKYFNPYDSPYEAFITYMNVLRDFQWRLKNKN